MRMPKCIKGWLFFLRFGKMNPELAETFETIYLRTFYLKQDYHKILTRGFSTRPLFSIKWGDVTRYVSLLFLGHRWSRKNELGT